MPDLEQRSKFHCRFYCCPKEKITYDISIFVMEFNCLPIEPEPRMSVDDVHNQRVEVGWQQVRSEVFSVSTMFINSKITSFPQ